MTHILPTVADIERIAAMPDPVLRNLEITQCYHELCLALTPRTGLSANWCTYATWASKQAGQSIRKQDFSRLLASLENQMPFLREAAVEIAAFASQIGAGRDRQHILGRIREVIDFPGAMQRSSEAVGQGNRKVYAEIGREFARFYADCLQDATPDPANIALFCEALHPGDPPDGQRFLRDAFARYYEAMFEADPKKRAELLLLANIEIGFHEQTRLQPEIAGALDASIAGPQEFTPRLVKAIFGGWSWYVEALLFVIRKIKGRALLDIIVEKLVADARNQVRPLLTAMMMSIGLPHNEQLRLGQDLTAGFPENLQHITHPDLLALLLQVDPTADSLHETGARDWASLTDRLHFIVDMFRCFQETPDLFLPPFSDEQVTAFRAGLIPDRV
jgi:hypothetical protein